MSRGRSLSAYLPARIEVPTLTPCVCGIGLRLEQRARNENGDRIVGVTGEGQCPTPGYEVSLQPYNEGIVPQPSVLTLLLVEQPPEGMVIQVITDATVEQDFRVSEEVRTVNIVHVFGVAVEDA